MMRGQHQEPIRGLDEKSFLKRVMERPGMYVGTNRLDYIQHLVTGYLLGSDSLPSYQINYEMQYWLLHTQGVVLQTTSGNGWLLFYRYFGTSDTAVGQFSKMLHADIPPSQYPADLHYSDCSVAGEVSKLYLDMRYGEKAKPTVEEIKAELHGAIQTMLAQQDEEYDEVRVYICDIDLYTQFRFVYHTSGGWRDDTLMLADPKNHAQIVRLHALIHYCLFFSEPDKEFPRMSSNELAVYFHFSGDSPKWDHVAEMAHEIKDEETLWCRYCKWKAQMTASY